MHLKNIQNLLLMAFLGIFLIGCDDDNNDDKDGDKDDETFQATEGFNAEYCALVDGTLNIHWENTNETVACTGIEETDGTKEDVVNGNITITGQSVTDSSCLAETTYELTLSEDKLTLDGTDTDNDVDFTLTRNPSEDCFVGTWFDPDAGDFSTYIGHISADFFLED